MTQATVLLLLKVIDGALFAMEHAPALMAAWRGHIAKIKKMIEENRDPTAEEWQAVDDTANEQTDALPELTLEDEHDCTGGGWITLSCMRDLVASRCIKLTSDCSSVLDIPDIRTLFGQPQVQRTFSPNRTVRVDRLKCTDDTTIKNDNTADERRSIGVHARANISG